MGYGVGKFSTYPLPYEPTFLHIEKIKKLIVRRQKGGFSYINIDVPLNTPLGNSVKRITPPPAEHL